MSAAKRARPAPKPAKPRPPRSPASIAHAAVAHEGQAEPGGKVKLTLRDHRADCVNPPTWIDEAAVATLIMVAVTILTGCSSGPIPPTYTQDELKAICERYGGWWHPDGLPGGYCEYQSDGFL